MSKREREEEDEGGREEETVYRDRKGRKLDMLNAYVQQQEGKILEKEVKYEWGTGTVQKQTEKERREEEEREKSKPFARSRDDVELDKLYREQIHFGDPMAELARKKQKKKKGKKSKSKREVEKPAYRGPPPPPNRFNIPPGYRWDGVDRSNKFEEVYFKSLAERSATREIAYKWSVEDM